jgi:hypothetical protein
MATSLVLAAAPLAAQPVPPIVNQVVLIGVDDVKQSLGIDQLIEFKVEDCGEAKVVGSLGEPFRNCEAIATRFTFANQTNFLVQGAIPPVYIVDNDRLLTVDPMTADVSQVVDLGFDDVDGIDFWPLVDPTKDCEGGVLYGVTHGSNLLLKITLDECANKAASVEVVAEHVITGRRLNDIAFDQHGRCFILTDSYPPRIYEIDPQTGAKLRKWVLHEVPPPPGFANPFSARYNPATAHAVAKGGSSEPYAVEQLRSLEALEYVDLAVIDPVLADGNLGFISAGDHNGTKDLVGIILPDDDSEVGTGFYVPTLSSGLKDIEGLGLLPRVVVNALRSALAGEEPVDTTPGPAHRQAILHQNEPNPFNPMTRIGFEMPRADRVELTIFSIDGRKVTTLLSKDMAAGAHSVTWDGRDAAGRSVAAGVYRYQLKGSDWIQTRSMVMIK